MAVSTSTLLYYQSTLTCLSLSKRGQLQWIKRADNWYSFRGPAPLQHTLLAGEEYTGVTLQTLDDKAFDHGKILAQTPPPGVKIPNAPACTYQQLLEFISPRAAELLVQGIRDRVFVPPLEEVGWHKSTEPTEKFRHAPKITPKDRHLDFSSWTSVTIERRNRVLGRLWSRAVINSNGGDPILKRFVLENIEIIPFSEEDLKHSLSHGNERGELKTLTQDGGAITSPWVEAEEGIIVSTCDGRGLLIREMTVEGEARKPAHVAVRKLLGATV